MVLGALLRAASGGASATGQDARMLATVTERLSPHDFYFEQHANIAQIVGELVESARNPNVAAIQEVARRKGLDIGSATYLVELISSPIVLIATERSVAELTTRIKDLSLTRQLRDNLTQALARCNGGASFEQNATFAGDAIKNLLQNAATSRAGPRHVADFVLPIIDQLDNPDAVTKRACTTGFPELDRVIMGLQDEELIILAGRPSMGKTAMGCEIACNTAAIGKRPTLIFSLEMPGAAIARRSIASQGRVGFTRLRAGELLEHEWTRLLDGVSKLQEMPLYIDESPGLTLAQIRARARTFANEFPNPIIFVDYLQFVAAENLRGGENATRIHVAEVSRGLKGLARELRCPVVALSQLSRDLEKRANKRPMMSDLRESGSIEQDADLIMFLYRDEYYNTDTREPGVTELIIGKQRDGPTGTVRFNFDKDQMRFSPIGFEGPSE